MSKKRNEAIETYLSIIYCPVDFRDKLSELKRILRENDYREIALEDANSIKPHSLILHTKGNGTRTAFAGYEIARIDIGNVSERYADIAIYSGLGRATPQRITRGNIHYSLLDY